MVLPREGNVPSVRQADVFHFSDASPGKLPLWVSRISSEFNSILRSTPKRNLHGPRRESKGSTFHTTHCLPFFRSRHPTHRRFSTYGYIQGQQKKVYKQQRNMYCVRVASLALSFFLSIESDRHSHVIELSCLQRDNPPPGGQHALLSVCPPCLHP